MGLEFTVIGTAAIVGGFIVVARARRAMARRRNPRDYAFAISVGAYPSAGADSVARLRSEFPNMDEETLESWAAEVQAIHDEVWRLATQGGPRVLGRDAVESTIQAKFPFLTGLGLRRAMRTCEFDAGREGFDRRKPT
jgi:hypothetical protein